MINEVIAYAISSCKEILVNEIAENLKESGGHVNVYVEINGNEVIDRVARGKGGKPKVYIWTNYGDPEYNRKEGGWMFVDEELTLDEIIKIIDEL